MHASPRLHVQRQEANDAACALLARAMRDNPTHVAVFGPDAARRQQRLHAFFSIVLPWIGGHGLLFGAFQGHRLSGVMGLLPPAGCRPTGTAAWRLGLALLRQPRPLHTLRWLHAWRRNDPAAAHWHLGPLAVLPDIQGRGVGTTLLKQALTRVDAAPALAHLETDLPRNVALYERLGFDVSTQKTVLGVRNWFMQRPVAPDLAKRI